MEENEYVIQDGTLVNCACRDPVVVVPARLKDCPVLELKEQLFAFREDITAVVVREGIRVMGAETFLNCTSLRSVWLPASLEKIPLNAFRGCSALEEVHLAAGPQRIEEGAFRSCESLTRLTIPEGTTSIGISAFEDCVSLEQIDLPQTLQIIEKRAFAGCAGLTEIHLPEQLSVVDPDAFLNCMALRDLEVEPANPRLKAEGLLLLRKGGRVLERAMPSISGCVVIPEGVVSIDKDAFSMCRFMTSVVVPASVKRIRDRAFLGCSGLESVAFEDGLEEIGGFAFRGCSALESIRIPGTVRQVKRETFFQCVQLSSVVLEEGVEEIREKAFASCRQLASITFPSTLKRLDSSALYDCAALRELSLPSQVRIQEQEAISKGLFPGCSMLERLEVDPANEEYRAEGPFLLSGDGTRLYAALPSIRGKAVVPEGVVSIAPYAFRNCDLVSSVRLSDTVERIEREAFRSCKGLVAVLPGRRLRIIEYLAFFNCRNLVSFPLPDGLQNLDLSAFVGCSGLEEIRIPASTRIFADRNGAFSLFSGCKDLARVEVDPGNPWYMADGPYLLTRDGGLCAVAPAGLSEDVVLPDGIVALAPRAFPETQQVKTLTIPAGVKSIGKEALAFLKKLRQITFLGVPERIDEKSICVAFGSGITIQAPADVPPGAFRSLLENLDTRIYHVVYS